MTQSLLIITVVKEPSHSDSVYHVSPALFETSIKKASIASPYEEGDDHWILKPPVDESIDVVGWEAYDGIVAALIEVTDE